MAFIFASDRRYAKPRIEAGWDKIAMGTDLGRFLTAASRCEKTIDRVLPADAGLIKSC